MRTPPRPANVVLMADDDEDDRLLAREAFAEGLPGGDFRVVRDGGELLDYLYRRGPYADPSGSPRPGLVLIDLNMPRMDGREAIRALRADPRWRATPVVVLSTSKCPSDIADSYALGANSFITKPVTFAGMVEVARVLGRYWFDTVILPPSPDAA